MRITKYKNIFSKGRTKNWSRETVVINSVLKTNPWTHETIHLNSEKAIESYYEKQLLLNRL